MATAQELEDQGLLEKIEVELDPDEQQERLIYAHPRVITWLGAVLPTLETDGYFEDAPSPEEQAEGLFYDIISGKNPAQMPPKCMRPEDDGIWELRTFDLRFFGWFWRKGTFILSSIETKEKCKKIDGLYSGHKGQSMRDRNQLDLDPPKFIHGSRLEDVL